MPRVAGFYQLQPSALLGRAWKRQNLMENFAQLLEEYSAVQEMNQDEVITAEVVAITDKHVIVNNICGMVVKATVVLHEKKRNFAKVSSCCT